MPNTPGAEKGGAKRGQWVRRCRRGRDAMDSKQRQLEAALQGQGWRVIERRSEDLDWWADAIWVVESEWSPRGTRACLTFLVDPQWEGPRQAGAGVWAVAASASGPSSRREAEARVIAMKRWDEQLPAFVSDMAALRGVASRADAVDRTGG
jgi:hypothetical protein